MLCETSRTRAYHADLRWGMVYQRKVLDYPVKNVSENLCVDPSTVRRTLKLFDTTGTVEKKMYPDNHGKKLSSADKLHILELVLERPGIQLQELSSELCARGTLVCESTNCRFLQKSNFSRKKMTLIAIQQSEALRARFVAEISQYSPNMLVFVDETGSDRKDAIQRFGYSLRGSRCYSKKLLAKGKQISAIAALSMEGVVDVQFAYGGVDGETFADFVELCLLPNLLTFDGVNPNSVVVMDNASIHYNIRVERLISGVGALLVHLPPYSPDLNPIEESFSAVKSFLKANEVIATTTEDIESILLTGFANISSDDCCAWYHHSGYC